ncbi:MAG: Predicted ATPase with chaperone activity, associated with Flp pilus assembly, partial [uncultured Thermomicrobiales bacterium]
DGDNGAPTECERAGEGARFPRRYRARAPLPLGSCPEGDLLQQRDHRPADHRNPLPAILQRDRARPDDAEARGVGRGQRQQRLRRVGLPIRDRPEGDGARPRGDGSDHLPRPRAGHAGRLHRRRQGAGDRRGARQPRRYPRRDGRPRPRRGHDGHHRAGREHRAIALPLRPSRQRQDGHGRAYRPPAGWSYLRPALHRRGRSDRQGIRLPQPHPGRANRIDPARLGPPLGPLRTPGDHRRRRADPRSARPDLQPEQSLLRSAVADEGEQRPLPDRRLRAAAGPPARTAQPLDRAAGEADRLSHPAHRQEARGAVRSVDRLLDQLGAEGLGGRGVPAPYPEQGADSQSLARDVPRDLPATVPRIWRRLRSGGADLSPARVLHQAEAGAARLPPARSAARPHRVRALPQLPAATFPGVNRSRLQGLLRRSV